MKNLFHSFKKLLPIFLLVVLPNVQAQEAKIVLSESKVVVFGTSNVHDWTVEAKAMNGTANYTVESNVLKAIPKLNFSVEVEQLKSGKKGMDENTYKALKSKSFKTIDYALVKVNSITASGTNYTIETSGDLTIAGVTKRVNIIFTAAIYGKKMILTGKHKIDMTTFNVEPPKALMGTIRTGKDVTVDFKVTYN
jgi:polyisoprenoid-binding protein YceI